MSDVVNCRDYFTCSACVREDCWWLVFEDFREECFPVLAGVPGVQECFRGPGNCRQFHCVRDMWDIYGILQVLAGGAGGALVGGGLAWNLLGRAYERLRDPNRPPSRWRQFFTWAMRIFRAAQGVRQGAGGADGQQQQPLIANGQAPQAGELEQVVQNGMGDAVNYNNLIRNQLMEIQALRQRLQEQEEHIRAIQQRADFLQNDGHNQIHGNQQVQGDQQMENNGQQQPAGIQQEAGDEMNLNDHEPEREHGNDRANQDEENGQHDDGNPNVQDEQSEEEIEMPGEIPASSMQAQEPGFSRTLLASRSPYKIRRPVSQTPRLDKSDSSDASTIVTEDDSSLVVQRSRSRLSQQQQSSDRLSRGLPATPPSSIQSPARPPRRPAAEISQGKFKQMIKNKQV